MKMAVLLVSVAVALLSGCAENTAASEACKGDNAEAKACQKCCNKNGANGYKYVNGACGCLGGG